MKNEKLQLLASLGYSVIPCLEDKRPLGSWKEYQTKARTMKEVSELKPALYGLVTGYNYLTCVDIDLKVFSTAKEQKEWWEEYLSFLEDNILDFYDKFVIKKTKNNGYHILFKSKRLTANQKIAKLKGHTGAIIETRGEGGMVIAYDSGIGKLDYQDIQFISDKDRDILFSICNFYDYKEPVKEIKPTKKEYNTPDGEITPWDDYNSKINVWDVVCEDFTIVRSLSDKYIIKRHGSESPHSGYIYKDKDLMFLFSTGTIYEAEKQYSAFSAYVRKYHKGDFSAAAKQLYKEGYGSRVVKKEQTPEAPIIDVSKLDLEFPIDVFPEAIQTYILECKDTLNSSIDYMGCSLLWVASLCIGNSMFVEVKKGWNEPAIVWLALVGKAGIGKTPSISNILFPLEKQNNFEITKFNKEREKFNHYEKLSVAEKKEHPEVKKPRKTQFIANDITSEALVEIHEENDNAVGIFKDELAGWLKDMNKYKQGSDLEFWLSTWSGKSVNLNRISRPGSFVPKPFIPVIGGIQPSIFNTFYTEENKDNGFMDRMLLSYPDLKVEMYNDRDMSENTISWFSDTITSMYEGVVNKMIDRDYQGKIISKVARFSPEAKVEWIRIFNEISKVQNSEEENEYMKSMLPKQKSYVPRFALLLNFLNSIGKENFDYNIISVDSILKAEKMSKYFISMAKKVKIDSIESSRIKEVIKKSGGNTKEKLFAIYTDNPNINAKEVAEHLGVSPQAIYRYLKEFKKE